MTVQHLSKEQIYAAATQAHQQQRFEDAKALYFLLIKQGMADAGVYNRVGSLFDVCGQLEQAITFYKEAVKLQPSFVAAHYNMANAYRDQSLFAPAIEHYQLALNFNPNHTDALCCLHHALQHVCAWDEYEALTPKVEKAVKKALKHGKRCPETPFVHITRCDDQATNLKVANNWANDVVNMIKGQRQPFVHDADKIKPKQVLTIGYISRNFRDRPTGHLAASLFSQHNRHHVKVHVYAYGPNDGSYWRKKIEQDADEFIDIESMHYTQAAQRIYDDGVDILVDMMGYMALNRLEIAALKPAPIQITYLGFPGTIGGGIFDYLLTDEICVPQDQAQYMDEQLLYMPNCYQVNDPKPPIASEGLARHECGLPEEGVVFCSFNWSHKLDRKMFLCWMRILKQVQGSVLWLWHSSDLAVSNLKATAKEQGVEPDRLIFGKKLPKDQHLARIKLADIMLDTRIYGGHTTATDCLTVGVPVISMKGRHFASRVGASLLTNIGLEDCIVDSLEHYELLAVRLGEDEKLLQQLKTRLVNNQSSKPLFDICGFVNNLEQQYKKVWEMACKK